jgi:hypothetical protein
MYTRDIKPHHSISLRVTKTLATVKAHVSFKLVLFDISGTIVMTLISFYCKLFAEVYVILDLIF